MKTVHAAKRSVDHKALRRTAVPDLEPNVERGTIVRDADTDEPVAVVAGYEGDLAAWRAAALRFPKSETVRLNGSRNPSATFGFAARKEVLRRSQCRCAAVAYTHPAEHATIADASTVLAGQLEHLLPERAEHDSQLAHSEIAPDWFMGGWWTSGVLNWTSPLPYHFDANNLSCWSAMIVVRRAVRGGHLHIPAYDLVVPCADGDVLFFAGYERLHGVTPMRLPRNPRGGPNTGYRISAVYYTVAAMRTCGEFDEGFQEGRRRRSAAEDNWRARQEAQGLIR